MLLTLLLLLGSTPFAVAAPTLVLFPLIRLPAPEAVGSGAVIPLDRLARVIGTRDEQRQLGQLEISMAAYGGDREIDNREMIARLRDVPELAALEIVGPQSLRLVAASDPQTTARILREAKEALQSHVDRAWPDRYRNLEIDFRGDRHSLTVSCDSSWSFDFSDSRELRRRTPVWLVVNSGGRVQRTILWFKVEGEERVWQALGPLAAKTVARDSQFSRRWVSLDEISPGELAVPSQERRLTVPMPFGEVLTQRHLERIPDVEFGEDALVISRVGDVEIRSVATAMQTAFIGDTIKLQSKSSRQNFAARVVDRNSVEIVARREASTMNQE
jgi:flagella basal body P-ring formation protein FlgA